jgi:hypothetical protein
MKDHSLDHMPRSHSQAYVRRYNSNRRFEDESRFPHHRKNYSMDNAGSVTRLAVQLRSGSAREREDAAREIWQRYFPALLELARRNLSPRVRQREDEDDVLQNMYASFCARQQRGAFDLADRSDLWRLLVTMTLHKARKAAARHTRGMRNVRTEEGQGGGTAGEAQQWAFEAMEASDPTPSEAAVLVENLQSRLDALPEPLRQIALWKLEGYSNEEIAAPERLNCTTRTVERKLQMIRQAWEGE